jgi:hypothetical protein
VICAGVGEVRGGNRVGDTARAAAVVRAAVADIGDWYWREIMWKNVKDDFVMKEPSASRGGSVPQLSTLRAPQPIWSNFYMAYQLPF